MLNVYFGKQSMLDRLDECLCNINPRRKRSLILYRATNEHMVLKQYDQTRKYKNKVCINSFGFFNIDKILIPVHESSHYTMYVVYMEEKDIVFFDTLDLEIPDALKYEHILGYIEDEAKQASIPFDRSAWNFIRARVENQGNGLDCGFCVIKYGLIVLQDLPLNLKVNYICRFR